MNNIMSYKLKNHTKRVLFQAFRFMFIVGVAYVILEPIFARISMSLMAKGDLYDSAVKFIPKTFTPSNYVDAWEFLKYNEALVNSLFIGVVTSALQALSCVVVGYGFGFFNFKGKNVLFFLVIVMMVIPPQLILTPLYLSFQNYTLFGLIPLFNGGSGVKLIGNITPFIIMSMAASGPRNGLYIFLARQMFKGYPKGISEAAAIDGANALQVFIHVMLPGAVPTIIAAFLFAFVWQWSDTLYTFLLYPNLNTVAKALTTLGTQFEQVNAHSHLNHAELNVYFNLMRAACSLLAIAPPALIYIVFQRWFIQSIERTGLVG